AETFNEALVEGIKANHSEAQAKALEARVAQFAATIAEFKEAKKGMTIALDWNGKATQVVVDGKPAGQPIEGEDFYRALLRIWLGEKPVQDDLKKALLGA
ncbi:MAG TPA: chalcone isomerase family protein, partial [Burkholderiales bacterium]|nr:chalcone isomerase family protein [Burkholderiales bacterium]